LITVWNSTGSLFYLTIIVCHFMPAITPIMRRSDVLVCMNVISDPARSAKQYLSRKIRTLYDRYDFLEELIVG